MVSFSFPHPASYKYFIILAAAILVGSTSLLFLQLQNRTYTFRPKRNTVTTDPITSLESDTNPPVIYTSPVNPFDINFDETLYRNRDTLQIKIEPNPEPENTLSLVSSRISHGNKLHKRDIILVSWAQIQDLMNDEASNPTQELLLLAISGLMGFLAQFAAYKENDHLIKKISGSLNSWRFREAATVSNASQQSERVTFLYALRSYEETIENYPDFMSYMERTVSYVGRLSDPDILIKLVFGDDQENAEELNDDWLRFLENFLKESAEGLQDWVDGVEFAENTFVDTVKEQKSESIMSDDKFDRLQANVEEVLEWSSAQAKVAKEASAQLREFRLTIREGIDLEPESEMEYQTPGTLPYTPGIGRPLWSESPAAPNGGNIFNRLDGEPLTPPSQIQDDEYIQYLRRPPWAPNQNPDATREEEVPRFEEPEDPESNM
ncbi:hypothetical protein TWF506_001985 [Arthrobotrys conoides]|uniref:Uncharacterized protein n=1 Tax=Arthrobotrys conoides TaxID=74498 RepID=A0AAN8PAL7_9PEZI